MIFKFADLVLSLFLLIAGAVGVRAFILYRRLQALKEGLYPARLRITVADKLFAQDALGYFEDVSFCTQDGLILRAWYKPSQNGAAVVFIHGKSNNRHVLVEEAAAVSRQGIGVLLYDSRACGESDGHLHTWGDQEQLDLKAALGYLASRPEVDSVRIGVHGFSVGANTAVLVAVTDVRIKALVLSGPCPSLAVYLRHIASRPKFLMVWFLRRMYRKAGVPVNQISLIENIAALAPRPLLMIRGTGSITVPVGMAQSLFDAAKEPKELLVIEGADHTDYATVGGELYFSKIAQFFTSHL